MYPFGTYSIGFASEQTLQRWHSLTQSDKLKKVHKETSDCERSLIHKQFNNMLIWLLRWQVYVWKRLCIVIIWFECFEERILCCPCICVYSFQLLLFDPRNKHMYMKTLCNNYIGINMTSCMIAQHNYIIITRYVDHA